MRSLRTRAGLSSAEVAHRAGVGDMAYFDLEFHDDDMMTVPSRPHTKRLATSAVARRPSCGVPVQFPLPPQVAALKNRGRRRLRMRRLFVVAAAVALLAAGGAFAGEVKGPPGTIDNTNTTGALDHARSACAASGLNDFDTTDPGQTVSQVQTAADSWKFYGFPHGFPGTACRGH
jgi:hypothetical protein